MSTSPPTTDALLDWALYYASHGFRVHPCHHIINGDCSCPPNSKTRNKDGVCESAGKHPRLSEWQKKATLDPDQIKRFWKQFPHANVGIATGPESHLFAIDVDGDGGVEILKEWQNDGILPDINTPSDLSGSGYPRLFFRHPGPVLKVASRARIAKHPTLPGGIDVRGDGGNIIVAPSHNAKGPYEWDSDFVLGQVPLLVPSEKLLALVVDGRTSGESGKTDPDRVDPASVLAGIRDGERNERLFEYACSMRGRSFHRDEAVRLLDDAMSHAQPPYTQETAAHMIDRVWKTYPPGPRISLAPEEPEDEPTTNTLPKFPDAAWRGVFADYRELMRGISECPDALHYSNLLAFVASEMGTRFVLDEAKRTTANLYVLNVGMTGVKKTTATDLMSEHIKEHCWGAPCAIESSLSSGEGLIRLLNDSPNVLLCFDEIADLLAVAARSGQRLEPLLNQAFDLKRLSVRVKHAKDCLTATNYYLNIVANGTHDHIRLQMGEATLFGGLMNRFLVFAVEPSDEEHPFMTNPNSTEARRLAATISTIRNDWYSHFERTPGTVARVGYDKDARAVFADWYHHNREECRGGTGFEAKLLARADLYVKKVAMIHCFLEHAPCDHPEINGSQMQAATALVDYCKESMRWMTSAWSGPKTIQQQSQEILEQRTQDYLRKHGCMNERRLYTNLHVGAKDFKSAVEPMDGITVNIEKGRPRIIHYPPKCKCAREEHTA